MFPPLTTVIKRLISQTVDREIAELEHRIEPIVSRVIARMLGISTSRPPGKITRKAQAAKPPTKRRPMSIAARARIVAAQKARWENWRKERTPKTTIKTASHPVRPAPRPVATRPIRSVSVPPELVRRPVVVFQRPIVFKDKFKDKEPTKKPAKKLPVRKHSTKKTPATVESKPR